MRLDFLAGGGEASLLVSRLPLSASSGTNGGSLAGNRSSLYCPGNTGALLAGTRALGGVTPWAGLGGLEDVGGVYRSRWAAWKYSAGENPLTAS